jgi:hypothetical protein
MSAVNPLRGWPALLALLLGAAPPAARPEATFELERLRQVRVEVEQSQGNYLLHARMLPVSAFDEATNARLNRDRARQCALMGLARHLAGGGKAQFEVAGARVVRTGRQGKLYTLTLSAPQAGVKRVEGRGALPLLHEPGKPVRLDPFAASFFTRKSDHLLTLAQIAFALAEDLREASKKVGKDAPSARAFLLRVAELEERADRCFDKVRAEVKGNRLLLELESEEVLAELKRQREAWRQALAAAVRPYDPPEEKEK